ncbi:UNVERIFIED_CONTAM: hypothetical protein HDU68_001376 [Siphonaria sp. JEL0065]|nr:hypothetical protein HDU68_001376 [Siphonaria sp. JEL0065]
MQTFLSSIPRLMNQQPYLLPEKLLKKYSLHFPLGEGATGFVAYATRNEDKLDVAIKCTFKDRLVPGGWKKDNQLGIVPSEVFIMKRLEHENIVRFYELFEDELFVYIVMEAVKHISFPHHHHSRHHHHHGHHKPQTPSPFASPQPPTISDFSPNRLPTSSSTSSLLSLLSTPPPSANTTQLAISAATTTPPCPATTADQQQDSTVPLNMTNLTSPTFAVPHPHDISSPSFPLLVKLNSKVDLTKLILDSSSSSSSSGCESESGSDVAEEGEQVGKVDGGGRGRKFIVGESSDGEEWEGGSVGSSTFGTSFGGRAGGAGSAFVVTGGGIGSSVGFGLSSTPRDKGAEADTEEDGEEEQQRGGLLKKSKSSVSATGTIVGDFSVDRGFPVLRGPSVNGGVSGGAQQQQQAHPHSRAFRKRAVSKDLFNYIEQKPKMGEGVARLIFKQIAEAVKYLHSKGFVHRDIKDENVIIDDNMRVKLIDFGASSTIPLSKSDWFTTFDGTIAYAPPECCPFDETTPIEPYHGPEQDVWSLGMLLYILVETKPPYVKTASRAERSVRPELSSGRSEGVRDLVYKMMEPDVEKRITMEQVCRHEWMVKV